MVPEHERYDDAPVAGGSTVEALRKIRRRRRWKIFFKIAAVFVVILIGVVWYAQTSWALRQIWLPMIGRELGTKVSAQNGKISYTGKLYLNRFHITGTDGEPAFKADEIWLEIAPLSILKGKPHIRLAAASNPEVRVMMTRDGRSNWDLPGLVSTKPKQKQKAGAAPQIEIDTLTIDKLAFELRKADQLHMAIDAPHIEINHLAPGENGDFAAVMNVGVERPQEKISHHGRVAGSGDFQQSADSRKMGWDAKLNASLSGTAPGITGEEKVDVLANTKGSYDLAELLTQTFTLRASSPDGKAGTIDGDLKWDLQNKTRHLNLAVGEIGREVLNPILAAFAPLQMQQGKVNGTAQIEGKGDQFTFNAELNAGGISFNLADQDKPTGVMSLRVRQSGGVNLQTNQVTWNVAEATLAQEQKKLVEAMLDKPLTMSLDGKTLSEAAFIMTIDGLTARNLQPWLMLAGVGASKQPTAGTLAGNLVVNVASKGDRIKITGELRATGLEQPSLGPKPVNLKNNIDVAFTDLNEMNFRQLAIDLSDAGGSLAQADVKGRIRLNQKSGELSISLDAPKTLALADAFQLFKRPTEGVRDGRLQLEQQIKLDLAQGKTSSAGKLAIEGMAIVPKSGEAAPLGVAGDNRLSFDAKRGRIDIESLRLNLSYLGQAQPGLIEVTGNWQNPPNSSAGAGEIKLTASRLNLTPILQITGAATGKDIPPIPFEANQRILADTKGTLRVEGDMQFGMDPGKTTGTLTLQPMTVQIKNNVLQAGLQVQQAVFDLASRAGTNEVDRVRIDAAGDLTQPPKIACTIGAERLNLNPYLAFMDRLYSDQKQGAAGGEAKKSKPAAATIDAKLTVRELQWKDSKLTKANGVFRYENGAMSLDVNDGLLNDGYFKGHGEIDLTRAEPRYAWNANIRNANASRMFAMAESSMANRIQGELSLHTQCTGEGSGETFKRTFQGQNQFTIINGEMHGVFLLDILAKQTLIESFSNMKFFDFSGNVDFADKVGKLREVKITGPEHRVDVEGQFDFDGNYNVTLLPAIATGVAQKIQNNRWIPSLVKSIPGFMQFPFKVIVKGSPKGYVVLPMTRLPVNIGNVGEAVGDVGKAVGGAVGGVVEKVPGSGVVTRPIKELNKLNPLRNRDENTTEPQKEEKGLLEKIPGSGIVTKPAEKLIRLNPLRRDRDTTR